MGNPNLVEEKLPIQQEEKPLLQESNTDIRKDPQIKKTRIITLISILTQLICVLFYFIEQCVALGWYNKTTIILHDHTVTGSLIGDIFLAALSIIYLLIFMFFVIRYVYIAILILASFGIIQLICVIAVFIISLNAIYVVTNTPTISSVDTFVTLTAVVIVLAFLCGIYVIITMVFALKLARLLKEKDVHQRT